MLAKDNAQQYSLRELTQNDLEQVANIHMMAFPDSFLSQIGAKAIVKYYAWHMKPPNICYAVGAFQAQTLIGFGFAGSFRNAEVYFILEDWHFFLGVLLTHPRLLINQDIFQRFKSFFNYVKEYILKALNKPKGNKAKKQVRFGVLSIAVDPKIHRSGIGQLLMARMTHIAKECGHNKMTLSVHPDNYQAIAFYEKLGWYKVTINNEVKWQGIMVKELDN